MNATARKQPMLKRLAIVPVSSLTPTEQALLNEAHRPTIRLSYGRFCLALLVSSAISLAMGFYLGGGK